MKSAIFQEQSHSAESRIPKKPHVGIKGIRSLGASVTLSPSNLSLLNWNLDELITLYNSTGVLPPKLSPKLPPQFDFMSNDNKHLRKEDDSAESDIDNMPMSLLSPTLPNLFPETSRNEKRKPQKENLKSELVQPSPRSAATVSSVLTERNSKSNRVRWINKINDREKPRFLMRITFKRLLPKYKDIFSPKSPVKYQGLGIDMNEASEASAKEYWLKVAKDIQSNGEKLTSRHSMLLLVYQFDWILCLLIAHGQDGVDSSSERHWYALRNEIPPLVQRIEKYVKTNNVDDKKPYLTFLVGILLTIKALILKRVNSILKSSVEGYFDQKDPNAQMMNKVINLQKRIISNQQQSEDDLAESQACFTKCGSPAKLFPKSWEFRKNAFQRQSSFVLTPSTDKYFLPLGVYSDLREGCAYLYCCVREFLDLYYSEICGDVRYTLQSGQRKKVMP